MPAARQCLPKADGRAGGGGGKCLTWRLTTLSTHKLPGFPQKVGLYDPQFEHDSCGVGFGPAH